MNVKDIKNLNAYLKRMCAVNPKKADKRPHTEEKIDGIWHLKNADGKTIVLYGDNFREAMLTKKL